MLLMESEIKLKKINSNECDYEKYMRIKFNLDDDLLLNH